MFQNQISDFERFSSLKTRKSNLTMFKFVIKVNILATLKYCKS
eukprot:UN04013